MSKVLSMSPGDVLMKEGDHSDSIFLLQRGLLNVFVKDGSTPKKVGVIKPGEIFGEMAFILKQPRSATVVAAEPSEVLLISTDSFKGAIEKQQPWLQAFIKSLIRRLTESNHGK